MRFTYLDILEQCFHDRFRGYDKQEVETFLQLVADDFKEMADEIEQLKKVSERKSCSIAKLEEALENLKTSRNQESNQNGSGYKIFLEEFNPEAIKNRAQKIIDLAKEKAEQRRHQAEKELARMHDELKLLRNEKENLLTNIKSSAKHYFESLHEKNSKQASSHQKG